MKEKGSEHAGQCGGTHHIAILVTLPGRPAVGQPTLAAAAVAVPSVAAVASGHRTRSSGSV